MSNMDAHLAYRFGDASPVPDTQAPELWRTLAARGSVRVFEPKPVDPVLIHHLAALTLCAPTKSDLQQRDIIHITDSNLRNEIGALIGDQEWTHEIPSLLIFCGNNRRQRQIHEMRSHAFANDHLDAFFNAAVDAGIALSAFILAAEAIGLGCCPISAVRNRPAELSVLLRLPKHVFPVAGLAVGWPGGKPKISPRLPLHATVHENTFDDTGITETIAVYDRYRETVQPYATQ
ncbi:MAG: nitroreductase family protein, partial [Hyphomicrobiaceae bacterium]